MKNIFFFFFGIRRGIRGILLASFVIYLSRVIIIMIIRKFVAHAKEHVIVNILNDPQRSLSYPRPKFRGENYTTGVLFLFFYQT